MKKSLLVAALIAGFAGVAQAETSVTLYGIVDAGIGYERVKGSIANDDGDLVDVDGKRTGLINGINSANRWGLKGTEDLGEGLQAIFVLENGFDLGRGTASQGNRMFGRQATVGLKSDAWGQLEFGRQTNIATKYLAGVVTPFGTDFGQAKSGTTFGALNSIRYDNLVMYQTPSFSGFQLGVGYSFNTEGNQRFKTNGGEQPNDRALTTGLRYANGPLAAGLTYDQIKVRETLGGDFADEAGITVRSWNLGASYNFEVVKVFAGFGQARNGWFGALETVDGSFDLDAGGYVPADGLKVNSYSLGLSAPVGANGEIMASWGMADPRSEDEAEKQQVYSLGYTYALSKRTNVYAIGSYAKHVAFQDDLKATLVGVGLRHKF
ncbi:porin [Pusillimonas caeni]|uniref:porin n=1 Tax=Pusillimonas caeni TaxID=1348472 RepID=UPI000E59E519|nr:porin [Pusillimonas caeni]TFL13837.1 porin [Pusillimonas caeni]